MKSYTNIEQSKKLAKILSFESADMVITFDYTNGEYIPNKPSINPYLKCHTMLLRYFDKEETDRRAVPCWSLVALLDVIPKRIKDYNVLRIDISNNDFAIWYDKIDYGVNNDLPNITTESAVDACYEMILKLKENKLL